MRRIIGEKRVDSSVIVQAKEAVRIHYEEGKTYRKIAKEMGVNYSTLNNRVRYYAKPEINKYKNILKNQKTMMHLIVEEFSDVSTENLIKNIKEYYRSQGKPDAVVYVIDSYTTMNRIEKPLEDCGI